MICFCIGLQGRFSQWCVAAAGRILQESLGAVTLVQANSLEEVAINVMRGGASTNFVIACCQPTDRLRKAISETEAPVIIALDDPMVTLASVDRSNVNLLDATRLVANCCAAITDWAACDPTIVLHRQRYGDDTVGLASAMARQLGLPLGRDAAQRLVNDLEASGLFPFVTEENSSLDRLDEAEQALVNGVLSGYVSSFAGGRIGPMVWKRDLFFINESTSVNLFQPAVRSVDITGKARVLIHGPHLFLPSGSWSATISLGFSAEARENSYVVEILTVKKQLAAAHIVPGHREFLEVSLEFAHESSFEWESLIEMRVHSQRAAFEGRLALGEVTLLSHIQSPAAEGIRNLLARALTEESGR
jgi:hypothetical protein